MPIYEPLTKRELEVLAVLVETGASSRTIAEILVISEATVENHLHRIFRKLDVSTRTEAAVRALLLGLVDVER